MPSLCYQTSSSFPACGGKRQNYALYAKLFDFFVNISKHCDRDQMAVIFQWIFLNENIWISMEISVTRAPRGPINNIPTLVQIMAWCRRIIIYALSIIIYALSERSERTQQWNVGCCLNDRIVNNLYRSYNLTSFYQVLMECENLCVDVKCIHADREWIVVKTSLPYCSLQEIVIRLIFQPMCLKWPRCHDDIYVSELHFFQ